MIDGINILTSVPTGAAFKTASGEDTSFAVVFEQVFDPRLLKAEQNNEDGFLPAGSPFEPANEETDTESKEDAAGQVRGELALPVIAGQLVLPVEPRPVSGEAAGNFLPSGTSSFVRTTAEQEVSLPLGKEQTTAQSGTDNTDRLLTVAVADTMTKAETFDSYAALRTTTTARYSPALPAEAVTQNTTTTTAPAPALFSETQAADGITTALNGNSSQSGPLREVISQDRPKAKGNGLPTEQASVNEDCPVNNEHKPYRKLPQASKSYREPAEAGDTAKTAQQNPAVKTGGADNGNTAYGKLKAGRDYQSKQVNGQTHPAADQPVEQSAHSQENRVEPAAAFNPYQANVKVSEAALPKSQPIDNTANLYTQISDRVADKIEDGGQESFKMKLFPEGLGEVQVTLSLREDKVMLEIVTETAATQKLLENQSAELKAALLNKNYDVSAVNISSRTDSQFADNNAFSFWSGNNGEQRGWQQENRYAYEYQEEAAAFEQLQRPLQQPVSSAILNSWA